MIREEEKLKSFEIFRKEAIDLLDESVISKDEFFTRNLAYINKLDLKPFSTIDTIEKGIYNYQYYNLLAKKANTEACKIQGNPKKKRQYLGEVNKRENFYDLKDVATLAILNLLDFNGIEAYFIELKSKRLQGIIFEINVISLDKVILHSKNKAILTKLRQNEVFIKEARPSLIDSYVNKSY